MATTVITPATEEPLSLAETKQHLRVDGGDEDTLIQGLISMARDVTENYLRRALVTRTLRTYLDQFPVGGSGLRAAAIRLPRSPVQSVSSVKYVNSDGDLTTIDPANYELDNVTEPAEVLPAYGQVWPTPRMKINAVQVEFVAGYGAAADVPAVFKRAMLPMVGHLYENREMVITGTIATAIPESMFAALMPYRLWRF